jgi:hypothetical protein
MAEPILQQAPGAGQLNPQLWFGNLVELRVAVTVRADLDAGRCKLCELTPPKHAVGRRPGGIPCHAAQPPRRDEDSRRESLLDHYRQRRFDEVGVAIIKREHDRARWKRLPGSAALAQFAECQSAEPLMPQVPKLCGKHGGANGKRSCRGSRGVAH